MSKLFIRGMEDKNRVKVYDAAIRSLKIELYHYKLDKALMCLGHINIIPNFRYKGIKAYLRMRELRRLKEYAIVEENVRQKIGRKICDLSYSRPLEYDEVTRLSRGVIRILRKNSCCFVPPLKVKVDMINPDIENHLMGIMTDYFAKYKTKEELLLRREEKRKSKEAKKEAACIKRINLDVNKNESYNGTYGIIL